MYVPLEETLNLIFEQRVDITKDDPSLINKFTTRPQGILVQDSYNNPFFQIRPKPRFDTSKLDLAEIFRRFRELHSKSKSLFLPWHFVVEMVKDRFYVFNTRPLDMKFPITTTQAKDRPESEMWDEVTKMFITDNIFDVSQAIHVCVVGDSNADVYTRKIYELIGRSCILPIIRMYKLPGGLYQRVFPLNLGRRFKFDYISKFIMR